MGKEVTFDYSKTAGFISAEEVKNMKAGVECAKEVLTSRTGAGNDFLGWIDLPVDYDKDEFARIKKAAAKIQSDSDVLLVIGIGGSYLGARAAIEFLKSPLYNAKKKDTPCIYFAGNSISSTALCELLELCEGKRVSVNVISKSGTTTEPALAFRVFRKLMNEKQWETGEDDEELFEYAMHPAQYEAYRSGKAKVEFKADVAKRKAEKQTAAQPATVPSQAAPASMAMAMPTTPQVMTVDVNGQSYKVTVAFGDTANAVPAETQAAPAATPAPAAAPAGTGKEVLSPLEGKFFLVKSASDTPVKVGDVVKEGDVLCYVEAMKTYNAVRAEFGGTVTAICLASGDAVSEDDVLMTIQ